MLNRYLFWTDWSSTNPRIVSAYMDGTNQNVVINGSDRVHWPNGLAIDFQFDRLYFTDAFLDRISYCNLTGAGYQVLTQRHPLLLHPYAIGVFKVRVYLWCSYSLVCTAFILRGLHLVSCAVLLNVAQR